MGLIYIYIKSLRVFPISSDYNKQYQNYDQTAGEQLVLFLTKLIRISSPDQLKENLASIRQTETYVQSACKR
ncbi:hypothetical protein Hanom_Chr15g01405131 [Helianthus anomalus]